MSNTPQRHQEANVVLMLAWILGWIAFGSIFLPFLKVTGFWVVTLDMNGVDFIWTGFKECARKDFPKDDVMIVMTALGMFICPLLALYNRSIYLVFVFFGAMFHVLFRHYMTKESGTFISVDYQFGFSVNMWASVLCLFMMIVGFATTPPFSESSSE